MGNCLDSLRGSSVVYCRKERPIRVYFLCHFGLLNSLGWSYRGDYRKARKGYQKGKGKRWFFTKLEPALDQKQSLQL